MSEEQLEYDPEWTLATLNDAKEALEDLIAQVEDSPEEVKEILEENIANVYAKLNRPTSAGSPVFTNKPFCLVPPALKSRLLPKRKCSLACRQLKPGTIRI